MKLIIRITILVFGTFLCYSCGGDDVATISFPDSGKYRLRVNETRQLIPETNLDVNNIVWTSTNPNVVTVNSNGIIKGIEGGYAEIHATSGTTKGVVTVQVNPDVYISGNIYDNGKRKAVVWKNETPTLLTNGDFYVNTSSIFVKDTNNIYVTGQEKNASGIFVAKYWHNQNSIELTNGRKHANAFGVYVDNNDVYVAGYESNMVFSKAIVWKNGVEQELLHGINSMAKDVAVYQGDVYVVGYYTGNTQDIATVWKNGVKTDLPNGHQAEAIYIKDGDIYITGFDRDGLERPIAKYWKNGREIILNNGLGYRPTSIHVDKNNKVTIAANGSQPAIWKCLVSNEAGTTFPYGTILNNSGSYSRTNVVSAWSYIESATSVAANGLVANNYSSIYAFNAQPIVLNTQSYATDMFLK